jgi:hypothetical protein
MDKNWSNNVLLHESTKEDQKILTKCRRFHGWVVNFFLPEYSAQNQTDIFAPIAYGIEKNCKIENRSNLKGQ